MSARDSGAFQGPGKPPVILCKTIQRSSIVGRRRPESGGSTSSGEASSYESQGYCFPPDDGRPMSAGGSPTSPPTSPPHDPYDRPCSAPKTPIPKR